MRTKLKNCWIYGFDRWHHGDFPINYSNCTIQGGKEPVIIDYGNFSGGNFSGSGGYPEFGFVIDENDEFLIQNCTIIRRGMEDEFFAKGIGFWKLLDMALMKLRIYRILVK